MNEKAFNLVDESWIRVMRQDCSIQEVSLKDALIHAHLYKCLSGEMEAQNVALLRLLIAVAHTIFTRVDLHGDTGPVEDEKTALNRWKALIEAGSFPEKPIQEYLDTWHERFWLVHPEYPFYQVVQADCGTQNTAAKLNGEVSESNNMARLFSFVTASGKQRMPLSEAARWVLFINGFDDCAAKQRDKSQGSRSMTISWLGKLGLVTAVGSNLFETIMLNMTMLVNGTELWEEDDQPVWELAVPCGEERRTIPVPKNLAGLFTLQSRRILLVHDDEMVTGYKVLGGDAFSEQNALSEPMTLWQYTEDKKLKTSYFRPRTHERARQVWRDFGSLVNVGEHEICPGVVSWCRELQKKGFIPARKLLTFRITCVRYDSSQSSSITDSFSDVISFHVNLLNDAGKVWIREINRQVDLIEQAAREIGGLAANLCRACGQYGDELWAASDKAKEQFYLSVDLPFRDWLMELEPEQDADQRAELISIWQNQARRVAVDIGRQQVQEKGEVAFVGRTLKENKKERHYSSPEAYRWFMHHIGQIYPYTQKGEKVDG